MNYFQQIAERLLQPGTFLLVLGAILVYTSGIVACVVALVGAILIFA